MSLRKAATVLAITCSALVAGPAVAGAQTTTHGTSLQSVPVSGQAHNGKAFSGRYTVSHFVTRDGKTYAVGTLTGRVGSREIKSQPVELPAQVTRSGGAGTAAVCPILHLTLGPLDLNLLGLKVHLNQVVLDVTAQSGPGNLLGNLLCGVAHLLDQSPLPTGQVTGLLNIVQQLLNNPALLNL